MLWWAKRFGHFNFNRHVVAIFNEWKSFERVRTSISWVMDISRLREKKMIARLQNILLLQVSQLQHAGLESKFTHAEQCSAALGLGLT